MGSFRDSAFKAEYSAVGDLLQSPLWSRGWIQQELIVAKKVLIICRKRFVDLEELKRAAEIAHNITVNVVAPLRNLANNYDAASKDSGVSINKSLDISKHYGQEWLLSIHTLRIRRKQRIKTKLLSLLNASRQCKIGDPRDRVFAFLGLSETSYDILPNYLASTESVFQQTARAIIQKDNNLGIIAYSAETPILPSSFSNPARVSAFVSAIMAPQLDAAQHILIKTLLKEGFVRAVQRIRLKRQQSEMPTTSRTNRAGRRSCITPPMQKALCDKLIEQPYLYRYEMADFLYRWFCKRVSDRSIGRILRSIGWTRTTIRRIAQQRDTDLRDHYLHRISQYKSDQLVFVDESGCNRRTGHRRWG